MATASQPAPRLRLGEWLDERLGLKGISYAVPEHANSLPYVLGGITLTGFLILFVTGIYLAQFYHPERADVHQSVIYIITGVPLGDLVRSVHFWTAQIVSVTVLLHMLRVLFTGSYKRPREINWFVGLGLLAITLGNGHITILPLLFGLLIAAHIFLIKQHGISPKVTSDAESRATAGEGSSNFGLHLQRMAGFGLLVLALTLALSLIFPAPLGQPGVAGAEVTKPWWMFIWLFPAEAAWGARALVIVPAVLGALMALVPIVDRSPYLSPARRKGLLTVTGMILIAVAVSGVYSALQPVAAHLK